MTNRRLLRSALLFFAALLFCLLFSMSTSPLYTDSIGTDSGIFMTIGKYWTTGVVPYVGLWDQKGPCIFAINALGWRLTGNWYGLFAIQVLCLFLTLLAVYRTFRASFSGKRSLLLTLLCVGILRLVYVGNSTEEYLLPLLCLSFERILLYVRRYRPESPEHRPADAFLYGVTFSFCLLTRLTNALGLCGAVLAVAIALAVNRRWINLLENMAAFLLGAAALCLPFVVYFRQKDALSDLLYGTLLYNFEYLRKTHLSISGPIHAGTLILRFGISLLLPVLGLSELGRGKEYRLRGWTWICAGIPLTVWLFTGNGYEHYGMVAFPFYALCVVEAKESGAGRQGTAVQKGLRVLLCGFLCACLAGSALLTAKAVSRWPDLSVEKREETITQILAAIPPEERDSFVAYNVVPSIYIQQDIRPCYRFFALQDKQADISPSMRQALRETFSEGDARWILFRGIPGRSCIADILRQRYTCVEWEFCKETGEAYYLYALR